MAGGHVEGRCVEVEQAPHGVDRRPHREQHATHIGVFDDRRRFALGGTDGTTLPTLLGKASCQLQGPLRDGEPLDADAQAGIVHHREHDPHALVLLADEVAHGALTSVSIRHDTGRAGMEAELVLDGHTGEVVALADAAVVVDEELGHDEA